MLLIKKISATGLFWLWVSLVMIAIDRLTKLWVVQHLTLFESLKILSVFNLTLAYNKGAAFSLFNTASGWQHLFLGGLAIIVSIIILYWLYKITVREVWLSLALCLILAGALGNVWDRSLYGYVVDFFDFHWGVWHFAIFNVADSAICIGACMLIVKWIWVKD